MAEKILLEIVTPERKVLSETVDIVVAPGELGEFGVLPGHIPFLCKLKIGELRYRVGATSVHVAIMGGYRRGSEQSGYHSGYRSRGGDRNRCYPREGCPGKS